MIRNILVAMVGLVLSSLVDICASAQSVPLDPIRATAEGKTNRACYRAAKDQALSTAWKLALRGQRIQQQFEGCIRETDPALIAIKEFDKQVLSAKACEVTYQARITSRPRLKKVANDCAFVNEVIPVSVLMRAELDDSPHSGLVSQLDSQLKDQLDKANIRVITLAGFEREFQELLRYEQCDITGEEGDDFRARCLKQDADYAAARDAIIGKMRNEFQAFPEDFEAWNNCGGLMLLGQFSARGEGYDVISNLEIDFASASDWKNEVPAKLAEPQAGAFDFSVEETARSQLSISVGNIGGEAIQKISNFINSHGCTGESTDS
ncbi:MAG: hypothetical protein AAF996_04770 [Pseudomonadota bacterium]